MNVGVICCKNHLVVSTKVAAQGRVDKYTWKSSVYSRIPKCIFCPLSIPSLLLQGTPQYISYCQPLCSVVGQLCLGGFCEWVEAWAFFYYIYSLVFFLFKIYLNMTEGCVGGEHRMGSLGTFLSECFY